MSIISDMSIIPIMYNLRDALSPKDFNQLFMVSRMYMEIGLYHGGSIEITKNPRQMDLIRHVNHLSKHVEYLPTKDEMDPLNSLEYLQTFKIIFSHNFNQFIDNANLNRFTRVTHLTFAEYSKFNKSVDSLPRNLTHLTFDKNSKFNKSVDNLPKNLTHLTFSKYFNRSVGKLPGTLTHLTFDYRFNQPVDNLPKNLTHLTFGHNFDQYVDNLPKNLTHLTFGHCSEFNCLVDKLSLKFDHCS